MNLGLKIRSLKESPFEDKHNLRPRILFAGEGVTLAHVTRPLVLANALDPNRYEVVFACDKRYHSLIDSPHKTYDLPCLPPHEFLQRLAKGKPTYTTKTLKEYVKTELALLHKLSPDLIVGDLRLSLSITAELLGIPYIALSDAHWSPYFTEPFPLPEHPLIKIFGLRISHFLFRFMQMPILKYHSMAFNTLRKAYGLRPLGDLRDVCTHGTWTLYLDIPRLEPTSGLPSNHLYIGPILWSPALPFPDWWDKVPADTPILYVTMGSSGDIKLMDTLLDALDKLPLSAMVATAARFESSHIPSNVFTAAYLPGIEAARRAHLVVCSGGSATVYQALSCGTPVLGFPSNADQYLMMEAVSRQGAGLSIRSGKVTRDKIRRTIEQLLRNDKYRQAAFQLKQEILQYDAPTRFSAFIDSMWENKPSTLHLTKGKTY